MFNNGKVEEMKQVLNKFKGQVKVFSDSVAAMGEFDGRDDFKKETLKYFEELDRLAQNECAALVKLYEIPDSLFTEADQKKVQDLSIALYDKTKTALKTLEESQKKFAREYNFEVGK